MDKNQSGFTSSALLIAIAVILAVTVTGISIGHSHNKQAKAIKLSGVRSTKADPAKLPDNKTSINASQSAKTATPTQKTASGATSPSAKTSVSTQPPSAIAPPLTTPTITTDPNSCLPSDASQYDKYYIGMTSSAYLATNSYADTDKFLNAVKFAGLQATIDSAKTVVFATGNYAFDHSLSASQLAYMNASPANMKSVIGWHIITSCVIWHHDINEVKSPITLNTLNGPVTYYPAGIGAINGTSVSIWDWYTSNGAVHIISGFIAPSSP